MAKVVDFKDPQRQFAIESGIPVAPGRAAAAKYPFAVMEIGESFAVGDSHREVTAVKAAAKYFSITHAPMKIVVRMTPAGNFRCWRVA